MKTVNPGLRMGGKTSKPKGGDAAETPPLMNRISYLEKLLVKAKMSGDAAVVVFFSRAFQSFYFERNKFPLSNVSGHRSTHRNLRLHKSVLTKEIGQHNMYITR